MQQAVASDHEMTATSAPGRSLLALGVVVALSLAITPFAGFYERTAFGWALVALVLAFIASIGLSSQRAGDDSPPSERPSSRDRFRCGRFTRGTDVPRSLGYAFALVAVGLSGWAYAVVGRSLLYDEVHSVVTWLMAAALIGLLTNIGFAVMAVMFPSESQNYFVRFRRDTLTLLLLAVFASGLLVRGSAIVISPNPVIDVYTLLSHGTDHLRHGRNLYAADYPSPYSDERAASYGITDQPDPRPAGYPPLPFLLALPFSFVGLDIRWANVAFDLLAACVLYEAGRRRGIPELGALAAGTYLHLPKVPFLIEQAWYEPMLAGVLGVGLLLVENGRKAGYLLLALAMTGKQFGVAWLPPLLGARRREWPWLLGALLLILLLVFGPFLLWDAESFWSVVVRRHLGRPTQYGSLTIGSALHDRFEQTPPRVVLWLLGGCLIALVGWRTPPSGCAAGVQLGTTLLVFCLFHTQGYFNYFMLCQYLFLLGGVGQLPSLKRQRSS